MSALGLRAGYKLDFLAGSPYWEKAILWRWIVLFFYVMTTDVLLVLVPFRPSEVWDQTLCSIPGYLPSVLPARTWSLCHHVENLPHGECPGWISFARNYCPGATISVVLSPAAPPLSPRFPCRRDSVLARRTWRNLQKQCWVRASCLELREPSCGHQAGGLLLVIHLGHQNGKTERSPGPFRYLLSAKPISETAYLPLITDI